MENRYAPPGIATSRQVDGDGVAWFSPLQLALCSLLAGVVAGGILWSLNARRVGRSGLVELGLSLSLQAGLIAAVFMAPFEITLAMNLGIRGVEAALMYALGRAQWASLQQDHTRPLPRGGWVPAFAVLAALLAKGLIGMVVRGTLFGLIEPGA